MRSACGIQAVTAWLLKALSWFPTYWLKSKRLRNPMPLVVARGQGHLDSINPQLLTGPRSTTCALACLIQSLQELLTGSKGHILLGSFGCD
jgi:hypothetical protein